jgi:hypothetical protein
VTPRISIASVDGSRPRRSLRAVAGWLGPRLNNEPTIAISVEGTIDPGARTPGPAAAPRRWPTPSGGPVSPSSAPASGDRSVPRGTWRLLCQVADGTNTCRVRYD